MQKKMNPLQPTVAGIPRPQGGGGGGGGQHEWSPREALQRPLHDEFADFFKKPFKPSEPSTHRDDFSGLFKQPFKPSRPPLSDAPVPLPVPGKGWWEIATTLSLTELANWADEYDDTWASYGPPTYDGFQFIRECKTSAVCAPATSTLQYVRRGGTDDNICGACTGPTASGRFATFALAAVGVAVGQFIRTDYTNNVSQGSPHYYHKRLTTVVPTTSKNARRLPQRRPPLSDPLPHVPERVTDPVTKPRPYMPPYVDLDPGADRPVEVKPRPLARPDIEVRTLPKPHGPRGPGDPPTHTRVPDGKKKISMPPWLFALIKIYHTGTEIMEAFDCMFDALPRDVAGDHIPGSEWGHSKWTGIDKVSRVLGNMEKVNWPQAIACMAYNDLIEDKAVGAFMRKLGKGFEGVGGPNTTQITQWGRQMKGLR